MDLSKMKNDNKLYLCRWYFRDIFISIVILIILLYKYLSGSVESSAAKNTNSIAGFLCLPIVWLVNAIWFFKEAFKKPAFEEQKLIQRYVVLSGIGAAVWAVVIAVWIYIFQTHRAEWGEFGDNISFVVPTGIK